jgi:hypothetical protein
MDIKKIVSLVVGSSLLITPLFASAKSLMVTNETKKPFTIRVADHCSAGFGIIRVGDSGAIYEREMYSLCGENKESCKAEIFRSNDCTGKRIVSFNFDIQSGVLADSVRMAGPYAVTSGASGGITVIQGTKLPSDE